MAFSTQDTISFGHVWLNGVRFKLKSPISPVVISNPPPLTRSPSDPDRAETVLNTFSFPDSRLGIGLYKILDPSQTNYSWFSTCYSYRNSVTNPEQVVALSTPAISNPSLQGGFDYGNFVYEIWNGVTYQRDPVTLSLGAAIQNLGGAATSIITYNYSGALYAYIAANNTLWKVATDPSVAGNYTNLAVAAKYLLIWDNKILRVDANNHTFASSDNGATWTACPGGACADVPTRVGWVQGLMVFYDPNQNLAPYASTREGMFYLDFSTGLWHQTKLHLPPHPDSGKGFVEFRNDLYISAGIDVYRFVVNPIITLSTAGLERDGIDGVPSNLRGDLMTMVETNNEMLAILDSSSAGAISPTVYNGGSYKGIANPFDFPPLPASSGYTTLLGWNTARWRVIWQSSSNAAPPSGALYVSQANNTYRAYWGADSKAYYVDLPRLLANPLFSPIQTFQTSCYDIKPWNNNQIFGRKKLAVIAVVNAKNIKPGQSITVEYGLDLADGTWYPLRDFNGNINNVITANGITELAFDANLEGVAYDWLNFRVTLNSGTSSSSPVLDYLTYYFADIPRQKWGYTFVVELDDSAGGGNTAKQQKDTLISLLPDPTVPRDPKLVHMMYRSAANDNSQDMRVIVYRITGNEMTGSDWRGEYTISVGRVFP